MNERLPYLREKTSKLTTSPGVYHMKDRNGHIIYIGKAKNLKNRVTSYFCKSPNHTPKVAKMVENVYDYDFIVTDSEYEALVLECSMIKQHKPKYNILLKDDKGYCYIKISDEPYPRLTAELQKNGAGTYIGPYTSAYVAKQAVEEANRIFMLPDCSRSFPREIGKGRPCLNMHIKRCMGVCTGCISQEDYNAVVKEAVEYIRDGSVQSVEELTKQMEQAADELNFELAARLRDRIKAIQKAADNQKIIIDENMPDTDVIAAAVNGDETCAAVIMYRGGRLADMAEFFLGNGEGENMLEEFIMQYYSGGREIPREILTENVFEDGDIIEQALRERCGHAVKLVIPKIGRSAKLVALAKSNAGEYLSIRVGRTGREIIALEELAKALGLPEPPEYIESYDISNLGSESMVAGMVVFENGRPLKKNYKKFAIKRVSIQNDFASMAEVLERRFLHYLDPDDTDEGFATLPDLILLDGGQGQVNAVAPVLKRLGINVPLYGMVKDNRHRTRAIATGGGEIAISESKAAFMLLTRIQDEVHRYSITFQRSRHRKEQYTLELTKIKGIGNKKAQKLLMKYKTKADMKNAAPDEIARVAGVNNETAMLVYEHFQSLK